MIRFTNIGVSSLVFLIESQSHLEPLHELVFPQHQPQLVLGG